MLKCWSVEVIASCRCDCDRDRSCTLFLFTHFLRNPCHTLLRGPPAPLNPLKGPDARTCGNSMIPLTMIRGPLYTLYPYTLYPYTPIPLFPYTLISLFPYVLISLFPFLLAPPSTPSPLKGSDARTCGNSMIPLTMIKDPLYTHLIFD